MSALIPQASLGTFRPHPLHEADRLWPETNCYVDLWIEILHALGLPPEAGLAFTARQDFEGDQFSFTKFPLEDLEQLFGLRVQELAIYDPVPAHIERQMARGRLCLVEVDPFHLPDTGVAAYGTQHGKTTIAPNRFDRAGRRMEYFHNGGYFELSGEDFERLFEEAPADGRPFRPYVEFTTLTPAPRSEAELRRLADGLLEANIARRPAANPIRGFQAGAAEQVRLVAEGPPHAFHDFAFHNLRLLGANFELMATGLAWTRGEADPMIAPARRIAEVAKTAQFQLARAVARRRFDDFAPLLDPAAQAWDELFAHSPGAA